MQYFKPHPLDHRFFSIMSLITFVVVVIGFGSVYGRRLTSTEIIPTVIHFHAAIFTGWLLAFVLQTYFVLKRCVGLHRKFGNLAIILAVVMLISGFMASVHAARSGHLGIPGVEFVSREAFLLLNLSSIFVFIVLTSAGWLYRNKPQTHKRLMLMGTVAGLAPPGISRLPFVSPHTPLIASTVLAFVVTGLIYDWRVHGRPHRAYLYSLPVVLLILPPVVAGLGATEAWMRFANFLTGS